MTARNQETFQTDRLTLLTLAVAFLLTATILFLAVPYAEKKFPRTYGMDFTDGYDLIATSIAQGTGYRWRAGAGETMIREPGYPLFLAAIFKVFGYHIEGARFANWLLSISIALMVMRLAQLITGNRRTALIASLLFLFHPGTIIAEARGGVEILFIFTLCVFMLALYHAVETGAVRAYLLAGVALGAVVQVRSTPLLFPVLLLVYLALKAKNLRERLGAVLNVAVVVAGMASVMTPWIIRNYNLVHEFVPVTTLKGVALQEGQYVCRNLSFHTDFYVVGMGAGHERGVLANRLGYQFEGEQYFQVFFNPRDEWTFNNVLFQQAQDVYRRNPGLLVACVGKNLFNFWFLGKTWKVTQLNMLLQAPLLVLALGGLYLLWKAGLLIRVGMIMAVILSILAVHLPLVAEARYSIPVFAFLAIPASVSLTWAWNHYTAQAQRRIG
jgi:4-amino-4-deoxy-L-arabinose transferase-like glycosyltransferase